MIEYLPHILLSLTVHLQTNLPLTERRSPFCQRKIIVQKPIIYGQIMHFLWIQDSGFSNLGSNVLTKVTLDARACTKWTGLKIIFLALPRTYDPVEEDCERGQ